MAHSQGFRLLPPLPEVERTESSRAVTRVVPSKDYGTRGYTPRTNFPSTDHLSSRVAWKGMIPLQPTRKLIDPNYGLPGWGVRRPPREAYVPRINIAALTHVSPPVHAIDYASRRRPSLTKSRHGCKTQRRSPESSAGTRKPPGRGWFLPPPQAQIPVQPPPRRRAIQLFLRLPPARLLHEYNSRTVSCCGWGLICDHIVPSPESIGPSPLSKYRVSRHSSASPSTQRKRSPPVPRSAAQEAIDRVRMPPPPVPTKRSVSSSPPQPISPPQASLKERLLSGTRVESASPETQLVPKRWKTTQMVKQKLTLTRIAMTKALWKSTKLSDCR